MGNHHGPQRRRLKQVSLSDVLEAERMFSTLMGSDVSVRRDFISAMRYRWQKLDVQAIFDCRIGSLTEARVHGGRERLERQCGVDGALFADYANHKSSYLPRVLRFCEKILRPCLADFPAIMSAGCVAIPRSVISH